MPIRPKREAKPKPRVRKDYPLTWHAHAGQFVKKIAGKQHRFGSDPKEAERKFLLQREFLQAGLIPPDNDKRLRVRELCNRYLDKKNAQVERGEIKPGTFGLYRECCELMVQYAGNQVIELMRPSHFADLKAAVATASVESTKVRIVCCRSVFKFGWTSKLLKSPVTYGDEFTPPGSKAVRKARATKSKPIFTADQLQRILAASKGWMDAAVLLGINCGMYSKDVSDLRPDHLVGEFVDNMREKTGSPRRCWLWPETREAIEKHQVDENEHNRVFLSAAGGILNTRREKSRTDLIARNWRGIQKRAKLTGQNIGFKNLRHTFQTEASQLGDSIAVKLSMAHLDDSISDVYTHRVDDERLVAVSQHVRTWLYGK